MKGDSLNSVVTNPHAPPIVITAEDFLADPHAAKYRDVAENHAEALARVLAILNDPNGQAQLVAAQRFGHPALSGVVRAVEADEIVAATLSSPAGPRFRQAVGVAVRLTMEALGWATTRKKGPVRGARVFKTSERYSGPATSPQLEPARRARAALEMVELIGDERERDETARDVMAALAASRRAENRPF